MNEISSYFKEKEMAIVTKEAGHYSIRYYTEDGVEFRKEDFVNKSLQFVEDAAENWALGIKSF